MEDLKLNLSQYHVLVVDDVPLNRLLVTKMLSRFNFNVSEAENGLEAIREFFRQKPDLVFLDILMPLMDGFEVLKEVRKTEAWKDVKIVILSALNTNEDIVKAYNMGANDFITKPIMMEKLLNCVAEQLHIQLTQ